MTGSLTVVGLGPGAAELMTPAVSLALSEATDLVGYATYLERVPETKPGQRRHASGNRVEIDRARHALRLAAEGRNVQCRLRGRGGSDRRRGARPAQSIAGSSIEEQP